MQDWLSETLPEQFEIEKRYFTDPDVLADFVTASREVFDGRMVADVDALRRDQEYVFEGAQGVLLDEWHGFHPFTTWSTTTFDNALELLAEADVLDAEVTRLGLIRAMPTRHGPGPFVTECSFQQPELHNATNEWQGKWRVGYPDMVSLRYAVDACGGLDALGMTCADLIPDVLPVCTQYETEGHVPEYFEYPDADYKHLATRILSTKRDLDANALRTLQLKNTAPVYDVTIELGGMGAFRRIVESATEVPLQLISSGPKANDKEWMERLWW